MKRFTLITVVGTLVACSLPVAYGEPFRAQGTPLALRPAGTPLPVKEFSPESDPLARRLADEKFQIARSFREINPDVLTLFHAKVSAEEISDVGGKFNPTDLGTDRAVPRRRLLFAGQTSDLAFIFYEHGAGVRYNNLVVFTRKAGQPWRIATTATGLVQGNGLEGLRAALRKGSLLASTKGQNF